MGYAWAPQITGLVRGEPKPGQRHRSNGLAILMECMEERASKSPTLDRARSHLNAYWHRDGGPSGTATWEAMCAEADAYKIPVKLKNGQTAERGLRGDAVIGWAAILKPPPEMVAELGMTGKDIKRFCADGFEALGQIEPRLFRGANVEAVAGHADEETGHYHFVGKSKDKAGKYCGNLIDANLCIRINEQFPAIMRGMGWPIDDLDMTDWERMKTDEAYRAEREAKRKRQGQSVSEYGKQRAAAAGRVAARIITDAKGEAKDIKAKAVQDAEAAKEKVVQDARAEAARIKAQAVKDGLEAARDEANKAYADTYFAKTALEREIGDLREYKAWKAQKDAQDAQEAARKAREEQEARRAAEAARKAQEAQERERQEQEARRAAQAAQEAARREQEAKEQAARPKTPEERYREAQAAIWGGTPAQASAPTPEPPRRPALSAMEQLKARAEAAARRNAGRDGPSYPGA